MVSKSGYLLYFSILPDRRESVDDEHVQLVARQFMRVVFDKASDYGIEFGCGRVPL